MEKNIIFGSNIRLPSVEGLKSRCEDELYLLMKEVDLAFKRKHTDLLKEVQGLRTLCQEKQNEIDNLKSVVASRKQSTIATTDDHTKLLIKEIETLKEQNTKLRNESNSLIRTVRRGSETENQLESLKHSLAIQQEENVILKDRMSKFSEQYSILQDNYQKLLNIMALEQRADGSGDHKPEQQSSFPNFINELIAQETEKYLQEETEYCNEFQIKMNDEIEELQRTLQNQQLQ